MCVVASQKKKKKTSALYDKKGGSKKPLTGKRKQAFADGLANAKMDQDKPKFDRMGPVVPRKDIPSDCVGKRARITTADGGKIFGFYFGILDLMWIFL